MKKLSIYWNNTELIFQATTTATRAPSPPTTSKSIIVLSADDEEKIPDPFPWPKTFGTDLDVGLISSKLYHFIKPAHEEASTSKCIFIIITFVLQRF